MSGNYIVRWEKRSAVDVRERDHMCIVDTRHTLDDDAYNSSKVFIHMAELDKFIDAIVKFKLDNKIE